MGDFPPTCSGFSFARNLSSLLLQRNLASVISNEGHNTTMKFSELVSADICQAAIEQSPAHRATLYHRRRRVAEKRLHECSGLSWGTSETLSCMYTSDHAVTCMGGFLTFFLFPLSSS